MLLPHVGHEGDQLPWRTYISEIGAFIALAFGLHLFHDIYIKRETQKQFLEDMEEKLKSRLTPLGNLSERLQAEEEASAKLREDVKVWNALTTSYITKLQGEIEGTNQAMRQLTEAADQLGGLAVNIDYMKVEEPHDGIEVTEAAIYRRAVFEIKKARETVDIFTSYLLETDSKDPEAKRERDIYFASLLELSAGNHPVRYRRIVQAPNKPDSDKKKSVNARTYLDHIDDMLKLRRNSKPVHVHSIDQRRPTTYVIIDNKILLWQINRIKDAADEEMEIYGMFIVNDPRQILITHFRKEFDHYWPRGHIVPSSNLL